MSELVALWSGLLVVVILVTYVAQRLLLPAPVLLVVAGLLISPLPPLPPVALDPELVLNVFLPLLIYTEAAVIPWRGFRRNLRPIGLLSIGLVAFTAWGVALVAHGLIPSMPWPVAFVLGAVISPPDDVAVAVVTRRLPIPRRIVTVLEGEGLINDVTALTLFRFALLAAAGSSISPWKISLSFLATLAGGIGYGLLVGWVALKLRQKMDDTLLEITFSVITPFVAYMLPEHLGVSGILSVVTAGILISAQGPKRISARTRLQVRHLWVTVSFLLNSTLFLVLGLQLKTVTGEVQAMPLPELVLYGLLFSALVIALRFLWVYPTTYLSRMLRPSLRNTYPVPPASHVFLTAYAGMRGAISMAAALAIPLTLPNGQAFPYRNFIVFITFSVILVTLAGQGVFLPALVRKLGIAKEGAVERRAERQVEQQARISVSEAGMARLRELENGGVAPADIVENLVLERENYVRDVARHLDGAQDGESRRLAELALRIRRMEIQAEREKLMELLRDGAISDEILVRIEHDLDLREARLDDHELANIPQEKPRQKSTVPSLGDKE